MADWCNDCAWPEECAARMECERRKRGEVRAAAEREGVAEFCKAAADVSASLVNFAEIAQGLNPPCRRGAA